MAFMKQVIIDVREKDEFTHERIADSINLPLSDLHRQAPGVIKNLEGCSFLLMCLGGKRASLARQQLQTLGLKADFQVFEGGLTEWKRQNKPIESGSRSVLPIMRQVQLVAGFLVAAGTLLAWRVHPGWLALPGFVGCGLMFAGATGFCGMAELLGRMPWNR